MSTRRRSDAIVADYLQKIGSGQLKEGQLIPPESALCASYGVSRSVVREAMQALSAKGFLVISQGSATQVSPKNKWHVLDPTFLEMNGGEEFFDELQEARDVMEPRIAGLAADRASKSEIREMWEVHQELLSTGDSSMERHAELDIDFHRLIASASRNAVLLSLHDSISSLGFRQRQSATHIPGAIDRAIFWHEQILRSIEQRDPDGAEAAMGLHMRQVREEITKLGNEYQLIRTGVSE